MTMATEVVPRDMFQFLIGRLQTPFRIVAFPAGGFTSFNSS